MAALVGIFAGYMLGTIICDRDFRRIGYYRRPR